MGPLLFSKADICSKKLWAGWYGKCKGAIP